MGWRRCGFLKVFGLASTSCKSMAPRHMLMRRCGTTKWFVTLWFESVTGLSTSECFRVSKILFAVLSRSMVSLSFGRSNRGRATVSRLGWKYRRNTVKPKKERMSVRVSGCGICHAFDVCWVHWMVLFSSRSQEFDMFLCERRTFRLRYRSAFLFVKILWTHCLWSTGSSRSSDEQSSMYNVSQRPDFVFKMAFIIAWNGGGGGKLVRPKN